MSARIVHVVTSASFLNVAAGLFEEVARGENVYVSVGLDADAFASMPDLRLETVPYGEEGLKRVSDMVDASTIAIFHSVPNPVVPALARAPSSTMRVWSGWGGDYYGRELNGAAGLLGRQTKRIERSLRDRDYWVNRILMARQMGPLRRAAARAADVFSAPIPEDLAVFKARFPEFRGTYRQLNYVTVEDSIDVGESRALGIDILLGNSATPENNHIDVMRYLAREDLGGSRIIVPLAYGYPAYADAVVAEGRRLFGERLEPLRVPLPLNDYFDLLSRCGVVVMGHKRQQAMGNILRALWQGAHVVLDPANPVLKYLRKRDVDVVALGDASIAGLSKVPSRPETTAGNRQMLDQFWSRRAARENVAALLAMRGLS